MGNSSYHSSAVVSFRALVGINSLSLSLCFSLEKDGKRKKRLENRKIGGNQFISGSLPVASVIVVFAGRLYYRSPTPLDRSKVRSESFRALIFPNWLVKQMGRKTKVGLTPWEIVRKCIINGRPPFKIYKQRPRRRENHCALSDNIVGKCWLSFLERFFASLSLSPFPP